MPAVLDDQFGQNDGDGQPRVLGSQRVELARQRATSAPVRRFNDLECQVIGRCRPVPAKAPRFVLAGTEVHGERELTRRRRVRECSQARQIETAIGTTAKCRTSPGLSCCSTAASPPGSPPFDAGRLWRAGAIGVARRAVLGRVQDELVVDG
jgi:hypothetical protein